MSEVIGETAEQPARRRRRAVRLTQEGIDALSQALVERWNPNEPGERMTFAARAHILGLSVATANKVMDGQAVDRNTLILAFKAVEVPWKDSLCEFESHDPLPVVPEAEPNPGPNTLPESKPMARRRLVWIIGLAALAVLLLLSGAIREEIGYRAQFARRQADDREFGRSFTLAARFYDEGRFAAAGHQVEIAIACARRLKKTDILAMSVGLSAQIAQAEGRLPDALEGYRQVLAIHVSQGAEKSYAPMLEFIGDIETQLGQYDAAEEHLLESLARYRKEEDRGGIAMALRDLGTVALETKRPDLALNYLNDALAQLEGQDATELRYDIVARRSLVLSRKGDFAAARKALMPCLLFWRAKSHRRWIAKTTFQLGLVEAEAGNRTAAGTCFAEAQQLYIEVGDAAGVKNCATELERVANVGRKQGLKPD